MLAAGLFLCGCGKQAAVEEFQTVEAEENAEGEKEEGEATGENREAEETRGKTTEKNTEKESNDTIFVDVCGAVCTPGVYELPAEARVCHALEAAGGLTAEAAAETVNQARCITDGEQIYVATREEVAQGNVSGATNVATASAQTAGSASTSESFLVNLNTATKEELMTLPGIGETKANSILSYRESQGVFQSTEELMNVEGIKEGTFAKLCDHITVQ